MKHAKKPVTYIYTLAHPVTNEVRYVGKTVNALGLRLRAHISSAKKSRCRNARWIKGLLSQGLTPVIELLDTVDSNDFAFWECYWIAQFKSWGFSLLNHTLGGEGCLGWCPTIEQKKKMSEARKANPSTHRIGAKLSPAHIEKIRLRSLGNKHSLGVVKSPEVREKIRVANLGNKNSLGRRLSQEQRQQISDRNKGRIYSNEAKAKISEANKGQAKRAKPVVNFVTGKEYTSIKIAAEDMGLTYATAALRMQRGSKQNQLRFI